MIYKASFDKTTKVITAIVSLSFFSIMVMHVVFFFQYHTWASLASAILLPLIYIVTYLYCPVSYRVDARDIVVHRPGSDVRFMRSDIKRIQLLKKEKLAGTVRLFGVGGLFGYYGQFSHSELGCMTWYATKHRDKIVLIELNNSKKIVVTPDEPELFVEQLARA